MKKMQNTDEHIVAIETKLSYLEDFINQLQEVSVQQMKQIDSLVAKTKILSERLEDFISGEKDIPNVRPPHY
ncbi:MAG: SlyX family protein [Treponema sp.]|nr:SlyX family protein [Treponema sp.]